MAWWMFLLLFFVLLLALIFFGVPVAFSFLAVDILFAVYLMGINGGVDMLVLSSFDSLTKFTLTPIPLFILMGELLLQSGLVMRVLDGFSKWMGRIPSRLSILTIGTGSLFAALSGSSVANAAMLGSSLTPEMQNRGYHLKMIVGPILAAGSLAMIIPPSSMVILLGSMADISVGQLLIAGIVPGIIIAIMFIIYYLLLGIANPSLAPNYEVEKTSWGERFKALFKDVLPMILLIITILVLIYAGIATPTESAAVGAFGSFLLLILYGKFNFKTMKEALKGTLSVSGMIFLILAFSAAFSQLLAYTGATEELVNLSLSLDLLPIFTIIVMLVVVLFLGTFIEPISILMITIPLYIPIVSALDYDLVWFGILMLICLGLGNITPPFGLLLFVMKGVVPENISMKQIYTSVFGIIGLQLAALCLFILFPEIILWVT